MIRMTLDPDGEAVTLELEGWLGDRFDAYRSICSEVGARYDFDRKVTKASTSVLPLLLQRLAAADMEVAVDTPVAAWLKAQADAARETLSQGLSRLEASERLLDGLTPYPFQRTGVQWLAPRTNALLSDQMGLGKTVQVLMALPDAARALVVVPGSIKLKWAGEVSAWRPDLRVKVVETRDEWRWPQLGEVVICSWGGMPDPDDVPDPGPGVVLVGDEFHLVKNKATQRRKRWDGLARHCDVLWGVTGTPLLGKKPELWSVLQGLGLAETSFGSRSEFNRAFDAGCTAVPDCLRKVMLRRRRSDVLPDLPDKRREYMPVSIGGEAARACDELDALLKSKGIDIEQIDDLAKVMRVAFEEISRVRSLLATAKIPALLELVEEYEEEATPLMVVSCHRAPIDALGERDGWVTITGDTPMNERQRIQDAFQAGAYKGIAGTIGPMGTGLDLYYAEHGIFVDSDWTPALNSQAEDRLVRIGATATAVDFVYLVGNHVLERRIAEILRIKQELIDASVNAASVTACAKLEDPSEKLDGAAELADRMLSDLAARDAERAAEAARANERNRERVERALGDLWDGRLMSVDGNRRGPCNNEEEHAGTGLMQLRDGDRDRASVLNGVGFSKFDVDFGHSLANQYQERGMLSHGQWVGACKLALRYRRQIGDPKV